MSVSNILRHWKVQRFWMVLQNNIRINLHPFIKTEEIHSRRVSCNVTTTHIRDVNEIYGGNRAKRVTGKHLINVRALDRFRQCQLYM